MLIIIHVLHTSADMFEPLMRKRLLAPISLILTPTESIHCTKERLILGMSWVSENDLVFG